MSVFDSSITDQLREKAEAHEKAAAEQMEQARRARAAIAALEGKPVAAPLAVGCQKGTGALCLCPLCFPLAVQPPPAPWPPAPPIVWPPQGPIWVGAPFPIVPGGILGGSITVSGAQYQAWAGCGCAPGLSS